MSAHEAHAGPMQRSLETNVAVKSRPSRAVSCTQSDENSDTPARAMPRNPTERRPHVRLPVRRITQSDAEPPSKQATEPAAKGIDDSHAAALASRWRCSRRYNGSMLVKK